MSRILGKTYEDIFQSFPSTNPDLNPIRCNDYNIER